MVTWHGEPPTHLSFGALRALGVRHAFTTRHHGSLGGVSAPGEGGRLAAGGTALEALGIRAPALRFARQVHGTTALIADGAPAGAIGAGDALLTVTTGHPLAIFTADCLAVILVDPVARALAVAHAGWRGTVGGILGRLVGTLVARFGVRPDRLLVAIGPSIGPCCYEVDEPVVGPLRAAFPAASERWIHPLGPGKWSLDLWQANADQLVERGVRPDAILNARLCTGCRRDLFFSYRKEGPGLRLAALAALE